MARAAAKSRFFLILVCVLSCGALPVEATGQSQVQPSSNLVVQKGTVLKFVLVQPLNSISAEVGDDVPLLLDRPLVVDGVTVLDRRLIAHGTITAVKRAGPKCQFGKVSLKVDNFRFPDSSKAKTEILFPMPGAQRYVPERFPPFAVRPRHHKTSNTIRHHPHNPWKWIVYAPLFPIALPMVAIRMSGEGAGPCQVHGREYVLPAGSTVAVRITEDHHLHY